MTNNELLQLLKDIRESDDFMGGVSMEPGWFVESAIAKRLDAAIEALSSPIDKGETKPHFDHLAKPTETPTDTRLAEQMVMLYDTSYERHRKLQVGAIAAELAAMKEVISAVVSTLKDGQE